MGPTLKYPHCMFLIFYVFDDTEVHANVFRFVAYILWLEQQSDAFEKYLEVKLNRANLWAKCVLQVCQL